MNRRVLHGLRLFTAVDGDVLDDGAVVIEDGRIRYAGPESDLPAQGGDAPRHDLGGAFVMPGMTDGHAHLSYNNAHPQQLDRQPLTTAMLDAVDNARRVLGAGFTSAISFGSAQGIDLPLKAAIDSGRVPGPRLLASDRDLGSTGSNADASGPETQGRKIIADGPWAIRAAVRGSGEDAIRQIHIGADRVGQRVVLPRERSVVTA